MPVSSKILKSLFGKSDNLAEAAGKHLNNMRASPEEEAAFLAQFAPDVDVVEEFSAARNIDPENVSYGNTVDAGSRYGSADDVVSFELTPAEFWESYFGDRGLSSAFMERLISRNKPTDPNSAFFQTDLHPFEDSFERPVRFNISESNQFDGGGASGWYDGGKHEITMNANELPEIRGADGSPDTAVHEITHATKDQAEHFLGQTPEESARWYEYNKRNNLIDYSKPPEPGGFEDRIARTVALNGDRQLGAIAGLEGTGTTELTNFLLELKQQGKLAYGEDFGVDKSTNRRLIDRIIQDDVKFDDDFEYVDPEIVIGDRSGEILNGFERNKERFLQLWRNASPEQKLLMENIMHRAGAVGGAAVLGGLMDDGS